MRVIAIAGATLGIAVTAWLVAQVGAVPVGQALGTIGWPGFAAMCLIHLAVIAGMGLAWRALVPGRAIWILVWGRLVRDAGSELLPLSQIGGLAFGARAVAIAGRVPAGIAAASTIVDVTLEFLAKLAYLGLGLFWLMHLRPVSPIVFPVTVSLGASIVAAFAFVTVQRHGFALFHRFLGILARGWSGQLAAGAAALHALLSEIYRRKSGLWSGFLLHFACWIGSALEVWVALWFAGLSSDFGVVVVIESLLYGIRTVAFAIPNAIGIQELAYVLIVPNLGITPEVALALSLLKRARDLAIGLPTFVVWQALEGSRLWR